LEYLLEGFFTGSVKWFRSTGNSGGRLPVNFILQATWKGFEDQFSATIL